MILTARVLHESEASFSFMLQHLLMLQFCRIPISPNLPRRFQAHPLRIGEPQEGAGWDLFALLMMNSVLEENKSKGGE